jgi:hypothetical protein
MKINEFRPGLEFMDNIHIYRCTDVGSRTVAAIVLDKDDERWYAGPPYIVPEVLLDEKALRSCYLSDVHAIQQSIAEMKDIDLTYSHEAVKKFMSSKVAADYQKYPSKGVMRFDRVGAAVAGESVDGVEPGEIYHPYSAVQHGGIWSISCYLPYAEEYVEIDEMVFISLPIAQVEDYRARKSAKNN